MKVSIIIPCYNEHKTIDQIVNKILSQTKIEKEIIIIDDCSTDGTKEILQKNINSKVDKIIYNEKNFGKGFCIKKGVEISSGQIILIQDADLEYDPSDYNKILKPIFEGNADVVYGSRFVGSEEKRVLFYWHSVGNYLLTTLSNIFSNLNLTDMENCYKAFKSDLIKSNLHFLRLVYANILSSSFTFDKSICSSFLRNLLSFSTFVIKK